MDLFNCTICFFSSYLLGLVLLCAVVIQVNLEQSFLHFHDNVVSFVIQVAFAPPVISGKNVHRYRRYMLGYNLKY